MKIGIDIRALQWDHRYRGIGSYITNVVEAIAKIDHRNDYVFFGWNSNNPLKNLELHSKFKSQYMAIKGSDKKIIKSKINNALKRDVRVNKNELDVFFQPEASFGLPSGDVPMVCTVYDLIEFYFKDRHYPPFLQQLRTDGLKSSIGNKTRWQLYKWHLKELNRASKLIAISNATKADFTAQFPKYGSGKIEVVPLAASPAFRPLAQKHNRPTILYVGAADYRKNLTSLVKAFDKVKWKCPEAILILVGRAFSQESKGLPEHKQLWNAIENSPYTQDIETHDFLNQGQLVRTYSAATVFVFPSLYEGFGMPVLEAMACGTPVVSYNNSSIPEVAGKAALLIKSGSDLSEPILKVLEDKDLQKEMITRGLAQAGKFTWEKTARATIEILEKVGSAK